MSIKYLAPTRAVGQYLERQTWYQLVRQIRACCASWDVACAGSVLAAPGPACPCCRGSVVPCETENEREIALAGEGNVVQMAGVSE